MKPLHSLDNLQDFVEEFCCAEKLPGISVAVCIGGKIQAAAAGTLNVVTGVQATTESIFQIGSITKVLTASVIFRLVERGLLSLDQPVFEIIEGFRLSDKAISDSITIEHLLSHTSGIPGDLFEDDSNAFGSHIEKLVNRCANLEFIHQPGEQFSYSNTAYAVAGRVIEVILEKTWEQAVTEEVYLPLEMKSAIAYPRDSIRFRAAMGHFGDSESPTGWALAPANFLTLGMAPAGTTLMMTASDLLKFAAAHMPGQDNAGWLSADSLALMQASQISFPPHLPFNATGWGMGWMLSNASGEDVIGHDGGTLGQVSLLRLLPKSGASIAALINGTRSGALQDFYRLVAHHLGDVPVNRAEPTELPAGVDLEVFVGEYTTVGSKSQVSLGKNGLRMQVETDLPMPGQDLRLEYIDAGCFAAYDQAGERSFNIHFLDTGDDGQATWLFSGLRLQRRVTGS